MVNSMSAKDAAERWGLTERRVTALCKAGRIAGAVMEKHVWRIPADAERPADARTKADADNRELLPLPVGISDYKRAVTQYYYVDKTLLIRDFIDELPLVSLFTRPRRFGKTLTMDMLRTFFEKTEEDSAVYFRDRNIWRCGEKYRSYQGKYPVIFLTFKDAKLSCWADTLANVAFLLAGEYQRHAELADSSRCTEIDRDYYQKVVGGTASEAELMSALAVLSRMIHTHHGTAPIIIIDEYDTPIQQGHLLGFYDEVVGFMRNLFSGGFKDNPHLSFGFLTGILRVAKESIFSGLNNLKVNSVLDEQYSQYFGFTGDEVETMARYYGVPDKLPELCAWYDGYRFGSTDIFNPWSVINYFSHACRPKAFWVSTSSNDIIAELLRGATAERYEALKTLLQGKTVMTYIDTDVVYPRLRENPASIDSFLLMTGYLKLVRAEPSFTLGDGYLCEVAIPNREVACVYKKEILERLDGLIPRSTAIAVQEALFTGNADELQKQMETLLRSASYHDTAGEMFYQGLMLGITAMMDDRYHVRSNRESGEGRYDLSLEPRTAALPGILIELKAAKGASAETLKTAAQAALRQMETLRYDEELRSRGVERILKYGVAFSGKTLEVAAE
ncbi:MAG: ATP-binding protein [Oscillospiraceae bacterium]|nr:ATP-binding protein [Oscillospiraceae bacterium]